MSYLLKGLIILMLSAISLTILVALNMIEVPFGHIKIAITAFLFTIFVQAFVMFYFIGVSRLMDNIYEKLHSKEELDQIFDSPPSDLGPYKVKIAKFSQSTTLYKRQTIPWIMLILTLGTIAFLLGGAYHTGLVQKTIHSGVSYGFIFAMIIGVFREWKYLGMANKSLRKVKTLFEIPDGQM